MWDKAGHWKDRYLMLGHRQNIFWGNKSHSEMINWAT